MKRKIGIAIMFGLICINILSGCGPSSNEKQTDFEELEVDYVINDDGTYTYKDLNYSYKIEVSGIEGEKQVAYVVLTNDKFKMVCNTGKIIPIIIMSFVLIGIILIFLKRNK